MEKLFMSAGIMVAIILCIVGIIKLPFDKFKEKHPKWYKATFTALSFVLSVGFAIIDELFILEGEILSLDFAILVSVVLAGVFSGYSGIYEGLGLKELIKKLVENLKNARDLTKNKKVEKYLSKIDDVDKAIAFLEERKHSENQSEV